jgi:hypothetical protein
LSFGGKGSKKFRPGSARIDDKVQWLEIKRWNERKVYKESVRSKEQEKNSA